MTEQQKISGSTNEYKFSDLVNIVEFKRLLESFYKATGIPSGLVDSNGEILSRTGWNNACALFHRANPESNLSCIQSNIDLIQNVSKGKVCSALCKNGLFDYATPIVIEGQKIATLFLGQILHDAPNMKFFQKQAEKYHYDKVKYLEAIKSVPIIEKERMEALMSCVVDMAQMLAENSLSKLREIKLEENLNKSTEQRIELKDILDFSPIGIGWSNQDGEIEYVNHQFTKMFGYTIEDIPNLDVWYKKVYPDLEYRKRVVEPWHKEVTSAMKKGTPAPELEANVTCKDGTLKHVVIRLSWIENKRLVNFNDITEHWKSELRNQAHDSMLEMVAQGAALNDILHAIVQTIESEDSTSLCSILLLDEEGEHLLTGASLTLPDFYNEAINGVEIGEGVGSCGTAAFLKKRVIVEDIMTHEYWKDYKELASRANLASCWSEPIISSYGTVLGTFAIYHNEAIAPNSSDIERISFAANLAAIAIENRNTRDELEHRAYSDYLTELPNRRYFIEQAELELTRCQRHGGDLSLLMFDIDHFKKINDKYGHNVGDLVLQKIANISRKILRDIDLVGRIGGEEFAIVLPQTSITEAVNVAERLRIAISKGEVKFEQGILPNFTASFGVTNVVSNEASIDELLLQADTALYKAKESGRNRVCTFDE